MLSKRIVLMIRLKCKSIMGKNHSKAELLRKSGIFKMFGYGGYWQPDWIPSFPEHIAIGNNVTVAADVRLYEHDVIHRIWNENPRYKGPRMHCKTGDIVIGDNVTICAKSIILYGVTIGHDAVIACGSIVTKNVPDYAIVAGNPARIIGDTRDLLKRRLIEDGNDIDNFRYIDFYSER